MFSGAKACSAVVIATLLAGSPLSTAVADEVKMNYQGLSLIANRELAAGKKLSDGVILIVHGTTAHGGMDVIRSFQQLFKAKGYNSLAINLSYGVNSRHGMFECTNVQRHRHADALDEIGAWVDWLEGQGVKVITLAGHSRGANQIAWFVAERDRPSIRNLVFFAPGMLDRSAFVRNDEKKHGRPIQPVLSESDSLIKAGKGRTELKGRSFLNCRETTVTAESFASYYAPGAIPETPSLVQKIKKPVFVVIGTQDEIHPDVVAKVSPIADGKRVQLKVIEGADAFFRDFLAEDAVDAIAAFLSAAK